jgi:hypothetical protein
VIRHVSSCSVIILASSSIIVLVALHSHNSSSIN